MLIEQTTAPTASIIQKGNIMPAMDETLVSLDCIHGAVSVVGSMNADYTVTTERLPKPGETVLVTFKFDGILNRMIVTA